MKKATVFLDDKGKIVTGLKEKQGWQTSDGQFFDDEKSAAAHEEKVKGTFWRKALNDAGIADGDIDATLRPDPEDGKIDHELIESVKAWVRAIDAGRAERDEIRRRKPSAPTSPAQDQSGSTADPAKLPAEPIPPTPQPDTASKAD